MADKKRLLEKKSILKREFTYAKGDVGLNFTLSMENSQYMRDFLSILDSAKNDLEELLKETKN